jgi:tRNA-dihydrouridine synthase
MVGRGAIGRPSMFGEMKVGLGWMKEEDLPWVIANQENWFELDEIGRAFATRKWCWDKYIELSKQTTGIQGKWMQRHAVAFSKGLPGAKKVRGLMHVQPTPEDFAQSISEFLVGNV